MFKHEYGILFLMHYIIRYIILSRNVPTHSIYKSLSSSVPQWCVIIQIYNFFMHVTKM